MDCFSFYFIPLFNFYFTVLALSFCSSSETCYKLQKPFQFSFYFCTSSFLDLFLFYSYFLGNFWFALKCFPFMTLFFYFKKATLSLFDSSVFMHYCCLVVKSEPNEAFLCVFCTYKGYKKPCNHEMTCAALPGS